MLQVALEFRVEENIPSAHVHLLMHGIVPAEAVFVQQNILVLETMRPGE